MLVLFPRLILSMVLLISAFSKTLQPESFLNFLISLSISNPFNVFIVYLTITLEFICVILLYIKPKFGIILTLSFFIVITTIVIMLYLSGIREECGCFGGFLESEISIKKIINNFSLIILTIILYKNIEENIFHSP